MGKQTLLIVNRVCHDKVSVKPMPIFIRNDWNGTTIWTANHFYFGHISNTKVRVLICLCPVPGKVRVLHICPPQKKCCP